MPTRTLAQFATVTLIWGSTWLVIKTQLGTVPPSWSVTYRFLIAGIAMAAYCCATGRTLRLDRRGHVFALVLAVFQFVLNFNSVYRAEQHVTSGLVAVAFALLIVPNAVLAWTVLGQRVTARFVLGGLVGMAGVGMLFWHELTAASVGADVALGLGLTLAGILSASIANIMQATPAARALPPHGMLATAFLYGALIDAVFAWAVSGAPTIDASPLYLGGVLYLGVLASAVAFLLYYDIIRTIGPAKAAYSSLLVPFIAMTLSTMFESYQWTVLAAAGGILASAGLYIALVSRRT